MTGLSLSHGDDTTQSFQSELEESAGDVLLESYQDTLDADNVFSLLDKNNDGKVTRRELIAALFDNDEIRRQLQLGTYSEVEKFVDEADNDGDDAINRQEFARVLVARGLSKRG
jgi:Ca2+-binding EF-hand superfamily protein